jgi:hypothetical protein
MVVVFVSARFYRRVLPYVELHLERIFFLEAFLFFFLEAFLEAGQRFSENEKKGHKPAMQHT